MTLGQFFEMFNIDGSGSDRKSISVFDEYYNSIGHIDFYIMEHEFSGFQISEKRLEEVLNCQVMAFWHGHFDDACQMSVAVRLYD